MMRTAFVTLMTAVAVFPGTSTAGERVLRAELVLPAPVDQVWTLWTTRAGLTSFFAQGARIEPRVDGLFEILFMPSAPAGKRGAEGLRILAFEPPRRLSFTWNAPPDQPYARAQRTVVTIDLADDGNGRTRLTFTHAGWGSGPEWDKAYDYFDGAWGGFVLPMLKHRIENGPVDWSNMPKVAPVAPSLKLTLVPAH
jgi:uncharacterized protein YndB with AHSA1/START domain